MAKKKTQKTKSPRTPSASSTKSQPVPAPGQMTIPEMNEVRQALTVQPQIPAESLVHENNTTNPPDPELQKAMGFETETGVLPPPPPSPAIPMSRPLAGSAIEDPIRSFGQTIAPLPRLQTPTIRPAPTPDPEPELSPSQAGTEQESEDNDAEDIVEAKDRLSDGSAPNEWGTQTPKDGDTILPPWWRRVTKRLVSRAIVQVTSMPGFRSIVGWDKAAYNDLCARAETLRTRDTADIVLATEEALRAFKRTPNVNDPLRWASVAASIIAMTATVELFGME